MPLPPPLPRWALPALLALPACCADGAPRLDAPAAVELGAVPLGETATAGFVVRNVGNRTVAIDAVALAEGTRGVWDIDAETADLFPGSSTRVQVSFTPLDPGAAYGYLEIRSDDPASDGLGVRLFGEGVRPDEGNDGGETPGGTIVCGDSDGDGHDPCDLAGDCDDTDPAAYNVLVDPAAAPGGDGTVAAPYATMDEALAGLDASCHAIVLAEGTHTASVAWRQGDLTVRGAGNAARVVVTPPAGQRAFAVGASGRLHLADLTVSGARVEADGGALLVEGGAATLTGVRAVGNRAGGDGGAVAVVGGSLTLDGCTFAGNFAAGDGGAVSTSDAAVTEHGSAWSGNVAGSGGALGARRGTLAVDGASFTENLAAGAGGAVIVREAEHLAFERSTLHANTAGWRGGGLYVAGASGGYVRNLVLRDGRAEVEGGGIALAGATSLVVANNTFVADAAEGEGGALWVDTDPDNRVYAWSNVVAYADAESGVWVAESADASVAWTLAWGGDDAELDLPDRVDDGGNRVEDPRFVHYDDDGRDDDDLSLDEDSPARDAGPPEGEGPEGYRAWNDPDGSRNDRGHTGGPGAE